MSLLYQVSPMCPQCKKGYLSHRENLQDDLIGFFGGTKKITYLVHRDFCSSPFCDYDHKTRHIHLGDQK